MGFTEKDKRIIYHVFLGCLLITINFYFFIFVHYKFDYAPNFAIAIWTLPFAFLEIKKAFEITRRKKDERRN